MANPYLSVHRRMQKHQPFPWMRLVPVLAATAAIPLVSSELFWFLAAAEAGVEPKQWVPGLTVIASRLANLVAAAIILHSYADLVRGRDRAILDVHPVQPRPLVTAIGWHTAATRLYVPIVVAVMFLPVGLSGFWLAYAGVCGLVLGAWVAGLGIGFMVHLGAVWAAYSPALSGFLDAVRGQNPRMQAALIYAPGVALLLVGLSVEFGAIGLEAALLGWGPGWFWLAIPVVVGAMAWAMVGTLADRFYVRASLLLAEVEGAWGQHDEEEQAGNVYLQRVGEGRPYLMRALRNGWRAQRLYATGGWLLGIVVAVMSWSDLSFGMMWGAGAVVLVGAVGARMAEVEPVWLDEALGISTVSVCTSRAVVACLYTMGVWAPVGTVLCLKHGGAGFQMMMALLCLSVVVAVVAAASAAMWHRRGIWAYGATGIVGWAGFVSVMG